MILQEILLTYISSVETDFNAIIDNKQFFDQHTHTHTHTHTQEAYEKLVKYQETMIPQLETY